MRPTETLSISPRGRYILRGRPHAQARSEGRCLAQTSQTEADPLALHRTPSPSHIIMHLSQIETNA